MRSKYITVYYIYIYISIYPSTRINSLIAIMGFTVVGHTINYWAIVCSDVFNSFVIVCRIDQRYSNVRLTVASAACNTFFEPIFLGICLANITSWNRLLDCT